MIKLVRLKGGMIVKKIFVFLALLVFLSGCGNGDSYIFSGSGENWDVSYTVNVSNGTREETNGTIKYIGEDPVPETVSYKIGTVLNTSEVQNTDVKNGVINLGNDFCDGCAVTLKDAKIAVEINWNGQTEDINLTNGK